MSVQSTEFRARAHPLPSLAGASSRAENCLVKAANSYWVDRNLQEHTVTGAMCGYVCVPTCAHVCPRYVKWPLEPNVHLWAAVLTS